MTLRTMSHLQLVSRSPHTRSAVPCVRTPTLQPHRCLQRNRSARLPWPDSLSHRCRSGIAVGPRKGGKGCCQHVESSLWRSPVVPTRKNDTNRAQKPTARRADSQLRRRYAISTRHISHSGSSIIPRSGPARAPAHAYQAGTVSRPHAVHERKVVVRRVPPPEVTESSQLDGAFGKALPPKDVCIALRVSPAGR